MKDFNEAMCSLADEIERLKEENVQLAEQLAKANERVKELIAYMYDAQKWFDKHDPNGYLQSSHSKAIKALNKFAIEKKIEGAKALLHAFPLNSSDQMKEWVEQLRKEQSND